MNIYHALKQVGFLSVQQWDEIDQKTNGLKTNLLNIGWHALAAVYSGDVSYSKAVEIVQQIAMRGIHESLLQQVISEKSWPKVLEIAETLRKLDTLPLLANRYLIPFQPIGKGGYASVYRCVDLRILREVAVKTIFRSNSSASSRFTREIETLCRLQHPHIVSITDVISEKDKDYLIMEFMEGGDLEKRLRAGEIPANEVINILLQILSAVSYVHLQKIIHRDIKPSNILFARLNYAKLADFGLIKDTANNYEGLTGEGKIVGTMGYIAPEVLLDNSRVSPACDIYSIALIGFYGLYGYHPFCDGSSTPDDIRNATIFQQIKLPSSSLVSKKLGKIILKALHPDPTQRISAQDFISELERYRGIKACEATAEDLMPKPRAKTWWKFCKMF